MSSAGASPRTARLNLGSRSRNFETDGGGKREPVPDAALGPRAGIGSRLPERAGALPGSRLDRLERPVPRARGAERGEDRPGRRRLVERVEVDPGRTAGEQVGALERGERDAEVLDRLRVVLARGELALEVLGDRCAAHARYALELLVVGDGDDAGDDRHVDAPVARRLDE